MIIIVHTGWNFTYPEISERWQLRCGSTSGLLIMCGNPVPVTTDQLHRAWLVVLEASPGKYFVVQSRAEETPKRLLSMIEVMGLALRTLEAEARNRSSKVEPVADEGVDAVTRRLLALLSLMGDNEREKALSAVAREFCVHCGRKQPAGGCPCERDE